MSFRFSGNSWMILLAMVCGTSMIFLDASILPVALPTIRRELGLSEVGLRWVLNIYFLIEAMFVILGGKLGDIFGTRRMFVIGLVTFATSSVLGGCSTGAISLVMARGLQGLGAAFIAPSLMAIIVASFAKNQRGKAIGIVVSIGSLFLSLGPFLGGVLTQYLSWRWVFFINVPISAIGTFLTLGYVAKSTLRKIKIDLISPWFFAGFLLFFILIFMEGSKFGVLSARAGMYALTSAILGGIFLITSKLRKSKEPFIDFSLFKIGAFSIGNAHGFLVGFLLMNSVFWPIFFQRGMGFSPANAGLWSLVSSIPMLVSAPLAGSLVDKHGIKYPVSLGFGLLIGVFSLIMLFFFFNQFAFMVIAMMMFGFSIPLILTPTSTIVTGSVKVEQRGLASGIFYTLRYTGATLGVAVLGGVYAYMEQLFGSNNGPLYGIFGITVISMLLVIIGFILVYYETISAKIRRRRVEPTL